MPRMQDESGQTSSTREEISMPRMQEEFTFVAEEEDAVCHPRPYALVTAVKGCESAAAALRRRRKLHLRRPAAEEDRNTGWAEEKQQLWGGSGGHLSPQQEAKPTPRWLRGAQADTGRPQQEANAVLLWNRLMNEKSLPLDRCDARLGRRLEAADGGRASPRRHVGRHSSRRWLARLRWWGRSRSWGPSASASGMTESRSGKHTFPDDSVDGWTYPLTPCEFISSGTPRAWLSMYCTMRPSKRRWSAACSIW